MEKFENVNHYIQSFPKEIAERLQSIRNLVLTLAPNAKESISYGMPYYALKSRLVYFAAYKNHIGFYPMPETIRHFEKELVGFKVSKGTVQFPHSVDLPLALIESMIRFRIKLQKDKH